VALFRRSTEASGSTPIEKAPARNGSSPLTKNDKTAPAPPASTRPGSSPLTTSGSSPLTKKDRTTPVVPAPSRTAARPATRKDRTAPVAPEPTRTAASPGAKKDRPTPSRREAEAARRQRVNQTLSAKEARRLAAQQNRTQRLRSVNAREATPEKTLMRDYVDARFSLGEFLLPSLVVILALSFLSAAVPYISYISTILMYVFILAVLFDCFLLWRGFKRVLAARLPGTAPRGLLMYGVNRAIQIRRFRIPAPRLKRGDTY